MVVVVNEALRGGWLEFLGHVEFTGPGDRHMFSEEDAIKCCSDAAEQIEEAAKRSPVTVTPAKSSPAELEPAMHSPIGVEASSSVGKAKEAEMMRQSIWDNSGMVQPGVALGRASPFMPFSAHMPNTEPAKVWCVLLNLRLSNINEFMNSRPAACTSEMPVLVVLSWLPTNRLAQPRLSRLGQGAMVRLWGTVALAVDPPNDWKVEVVREFEGHECSKGHQG